MRRTRWIQGGLLLLLAVCVAQVLYWILDQARFTGVVRDRERSWMQADVRAAERLDALGVGAPEILALFPHLVHESAEGAGGYHLNGQARRMIDDERARRLNRYGWEGTFFLAVLLSGMGVLWHALRRDHELRQRQDNFLAAVGHELKSPTASLRLSLDTLERGRESAERRGVLVGRMTSDLDRLEALLLNLLDAARLEEGRFDLRPESLDLCELVPEVCAPLEARAAEKDVELVYELHPPAELRMDAVAARTVLSNLVDNALKSCVSAGGGRVRVFARASAGRVELEVEDSGVGFEPSEANKLFDKFYRVGSELRREQRGAGLGLFLVKRLVRLAGGRIEAASAGPGQGASFRVSWPAGKKGAA